MLPLSAPVAQQGRVLDAGTLLVKVDSRLVAREEFVLRSGRGSGAAAGFTLTTTIVYPPEYPQRRFTAVVEYEPDSQPAAARFEVENTRTVLYRLGARRMTVRIGTDESESAREYPGGGSYVALDDSVFGYHAVLGAYRPGPAHTFSSRGDRGYQIQIEDRGLEATSIGGVSERLHHIRLTGGPVDRHLWFDTQGRLVQITIPDRRTTVVRESEPSGSQ
jgi:hypothetical protein